MRKNLLLAASLLLATPAMADWTGKDASGATITFKNTGTCSSVVCVPIAQLVDGTGAAFGVTGSPLFISFGSGVTLPGFAATPTFNLGTLNGAATAIKQPALGTAGSASTDVITVQGIAGGVPQPISAASGAIVDGGDVTQGSKTDAACAGDNTSGCTVEQRLQRIAQNLTTLNTTAGSPASLAVNVTPTDCSGTVTTGGTAVNAFTAQTTLHGFTILNDDTSEPLWISFTTTAAASTAGSYPLAPATATSFAGANSFTTPPGFGTNHALSVVAATNSHKYSCTWW